MMDKIKDENVETFWKGSMDKNNHCLPVYESTFGIHQIEFVIETSPSFSNSRGIRQHTNGSLDFGQITSWNYRRWLIIDSNLNQIFFKFNFR